MADFDEIYEQILNASYYQRVSTGKNCAKKIKKHVKEITNFSESRLNNLILGSLRAVIGADDELSEDEYDYICDVLDIDMSFEQMFNFFYNMSNDDINLTKKFINALPEDERVSFIILAICICAADGEISHEEHRALKKYF